ncbi:MAG: DNA mismatch repair protein MutS [Clostridiales bacterium]|nr:DNA mismatch repair protein MutS [Clostridiales bacterium]
MAQLTPMMQQYMEIKQEHPDAILFYRLGDFYEMFFDDALTASRELELTLTGRECGLEERAPMCGVPYHAADSYIARLIARGYRVAICEQVEDPALAKGLVKRQVIRIVTPGTVSDYSTLNERANNFLCAVYITGTRAALALCDVTTGEFFVRGPMDAQRELRTALASYGPREIITNAADKLHSMTDAFVQSYPARAFALGNARQQLQQHFRVASLEALGLDRSMQASASAAGALLHFLQDTQKMDLGHIITLRVLAANQSMPLDAATRRNLELTQSLRAQTAYGSLLWLLDKTATAMGGRLLRSWVEQPLLERELIEERLQAVQALYEQPVLCEALLERLQQVYDMERLLSRIAYRSLHARDCLSLLRSLHQVPDVLNLLEMVDAGGLQAAARLLNPLFELVRLLEEAIDPEPPLALSDGGVIRPGFNKRLDDYRAAATQGKQWLMDLEAREREKTGIKNLKVQFNRVFGYYIEVTKSNYALVPDHYTRKQILANVERFTTEELKELEQRIVGAQGEALRLEAELFDQVRDTLQQNLPALQSTAQGFKTVDALLSLARVARENGYVSPTLNEEGRLLIKDGRHPIVERTLAEQSFVPNDTDMDNDQKRMLILTGPNMAGKSTYMRQTALIVLMAHIGSFVPAASADIPLSDNIYTRIGASDDLASGQSTFMVEMTELAYILRNATPRSLVILDEIGRGTGTFDGLSIAWAAVEYLTDKSRCGAITLFATHYHELSELEGTLEGVVNCCVAVQEMGEEVIFLRKIVRGGADKSFGSYVAHLAGVPKPVVSRAMEIQARLEANNFNQTAIGKGILEKGRSKRKEQMQLFETGRAELVEELANLDVLSMSPIDALNALFLLREKARKL